MKLPIARAALLGLAACGAPDDRASTASTASHHAAPQRAGAGIDDGLGPMLGTWRVNGVEVATGGVQALVPDDPSNMGAVLDVTRERLAFRPRSTGTFGDVCTGPRLAPDGRIACREGGFGPPGARLRLEGGRLRLNWYDGGTLVLGRGPG